MQNLVEVEEITVSSIEIAEMTGKLHKNVMRDIRAMLDSLEVGSDLGSSLKGTNSMGTNLSPLFKGTYIDSKGRTKPLYNLPKREALILASGYDVKLRAKIIDRLTELEELNRPKELSQAQLLLQQARMLVDQEAKLLAIDTRVVELETSRNKTILPPSGFSSATQLAEISAVSIAFIKHCIYIIEPKTSNAVHQLDDGSVKPYRVYKTSKVLKFIKRVKESSRPIEEGSEYLTSPLTGKKRFKLVY